MRTLGRRIDFAAGEMYEINKVCKTLLTSWGGTTSARQIDMLNRMARRGRRAPQAGQKL